MEQAFIKIKLLVNDAKDVEKYLREIDDKTKQAGKNLSTFGKWVDIGDKLAKGFLGSKFFRMAIDAMQKSVETTNEAMTSTDEAIINRRSYGNLFGTQDQIQATVIQQLLERTGAKNPYMLAQNFMMKLAEARSTEEGSDKMLKQYAGMSNADALITLLKDLQAKNGFSASDRAKILSNVFGNVYGDNVGRLLGSQNITTIQKDIETTANRIAKQGSFANPKEMFKIQEDMAMQRQSELTRQKYQQDLIVANKVSNPQYTEARLKEIDLLNLRDQNRIDAYLNAQQLNSVIQNGKNVTEALGQGALNVTATMSKAFTDFGGFWNDLKDDWKNNIVPQFKSGFGLRKVVDTETIDNNDRVGKK